MNVQINFLAMLWSFQAGGWATINRPMTGDDPTPDLFRSDTKLGAYQVQIDDLYKIAEIYKNVNMW